MLLCSDGLNQELSDPEITAVLNAYDRELASQEFIDLTNERGARDNVTVAVIRFEEITGFKETATIRQSAAKKGSCRKLAPRGEAAIWLSLSGSSN